jgi:hypothetical protein
MFELRNLNEVAIDEKEQDSLDKSERNERL